MNNIYLDPKEIKEKFPLCYKKITEYVHSPLKELLNFANADERESISSAFEQITDPLISNIGRGLYDFFDEQNIVITTSVNEKWNYHISSRNLVTTSIQSFNNRKDCEKEAFITAFELLEKNLKDGNSN